MTGQAMQIGMLMASMSRNAGGLFSATCELSQTLQIEGTEVRVFAGRDQYSEADIPCWAGVGLSLHDVRGPAAFGFQSRLAENLQNTAPQVLHQHGLWMYPSCVALRWSLAGRPVIISPHGMLDPWALRNASWKKWVVSRLYERANLRRASCLHALCRSELESIRAYGLTNPVAVVPNGVNPAMADAAHSAPNWVLDLPEKARAMLFLGRIHPKKGLSVLIAGLGAALRDDSNLPWYLIIAGWDQGGHQEELQRQVINMGLTTRVRFIGPQFGQAKLATFAHADAFVLPSFSEGLPMAVLEAWAFRLPVLMTSQCNLVEGANYGAGIVVQPEVAAIASALAKMTKMSSEQLADMGRKGRELVETRFTWSVVVRQFADVYRWLLVGGTHPDCVDFVEVPND